MYPSVSNRFNKWLKKKFNYLRFFKIRLDLPENARINPVGLGGPAGIHRVKRTTGPRVNVQLSNETTCDYYLLKTTPCLEPVYGPR